MMLFLASQAGAYIELISLITAIGGLLYSGWRYVIKPLFRFVVFAKSFASKIDTIHNELKPNGGKSIKDTINRIDSSQQVLGQIVKALSSALSLGYLICNESGALIEASPDLCKLIRRSERELLGFNWETCVHPDDRQLVSDAWADATADRKNFDMVYRFVDTDGNAIKVRSVAYVLLDDHNSFKGYYGIISGVE